MKRHRDKMETTASLAGPGEEEGEEKRRVARGRGLEGKSRRGRRE